MELSELFLFITRITWLSGLAFAAGFILLIIEMFLPGFGVAGTSGLILIVVGIISISKSFIDALIIILILILLLALVFFILYRSGVNGKLSKTVVLNQMLDKESGFSSSENLSHFVGRTVVTQGEFINKGTPIKVIKVEGPRIIVEAKENNNRYKLK